MSMSAQKDDIQDAATYPSGNYLDKWNSLRHTHPSHIGHREVRIAWADLQQWSQKAPAREEEKGQMHEAVPFGGMPRNILLMFHALRCWQVYKWQILKNTPLWYNVKAKSWTNRLPSTIWLLWLSELSLWFASSKNANLSFSKYVCQTILIAIIIKTWKPNPSCN